MAFDHNSDANRAFVQGLMARGSLTFDEARPMIAAIFNAQDPEADPMSAEDVTQEQFLSFVSAATHALAHYDYQIKHTQHQTTRKRIYAVINVSDDAVTQLATTRTADELSYIKRLLHAMFDKCNTRRLEIMAVNSTDALILRRPPANRHQNEGEDGQATQKNPDKGLTLDATETLLQELVDEGWLERTPKRNYTLSPRGLMELRRWLIETFNDPDAEPDEWQRIKMCEACREIVTIGQRCADPGCNVRIHDICENAYFRTRRDKRCPKCQSEWRGDNYVGERALGRDRAVRQSGGRQSSGATPRPNGVYDGRRSWTAASTPAAEPDPEDYETEDSDD